MHSASAWRVGRRPIEVGHARGVRSACPRPSPPVGAPARRRHAALRVCLFALGLGAWTAGAAHAQTGPYPTASHGVSFIFGATPTAAGTVETESGATVGGSFWSVPLLFKWTPAQTPRTEIAVGFDTLSRIELDDGRSTGFGDRVTLQVRHLLGEAGGVTFAIAPKAVVFLRDSTGALLGGTLVGEKAWGPHSLGVNLGLAVATKATPENPRVGFNGAFDYSYAVRDGVGVFAGLQYTALTGATGLVGLEQGVTWSIRPNVALEGGVQELGLNSPERIVQFLTTLVVNWGRVQ